MSTVSTPHKRDARSEDEARSRAEARGRAEGLGVGWTVVSYLFAGMAAYGGIGWLIGRATGIALLFPVGMIVGLGLALTYIIYRYGRAAAGPGAASADTDRIKETGMSATAGPRASRRRGTPRKENR